VVRSSRIVTLTGTGTYTSLALFETVSLAANDYIELVFASTDTAVTIDAVPATAFAPASPAVELEVTQAQQ